MAASGRLRWGLAAAGERRQCSVPHPFACEMTRLALATTPEFVPKLVTTLREG
jgi:hypothetical protein